MRARIGRCLCSIGLHKVRTVPLVYPKDHEANSYDSAYPITTRMCVRWGCPKGRAEMCQI
jgi:hypothetical protein